MAADNLPVAPTDAPPLRNRFKATLALAGETISSWARSKGHTESLVWMNLSGVRNNPEIRDDIAAELRMATDDLNAEIERERAA